LRLKSLGSDNRSPDKGAKNTEGKRGDEGFNCEYGPIAFFSKREEKWGQRVSRWIHLENQDPENTTQGQKVVLGGKKYSREENAGKGKKRKEKGRDSDQIHIANIGGGERRKKEPTQEKGTPQRRETQKKDLGNHRKEGGDTVFNASNLRSKEEG